MKRLFVFCGPVACGKTTFIEKIIKKYPNFTFFDVFNYIQKYKDTSGHIDTDKTLLAYQTIYQDINQSQNQDIILELGTNWAELNMENIKYLSKNFKTKIIFCTLDSNICYQRVLKRGKKDSKRIINKLDLLEKLKRIFPDNHVNLADKYQLDYCLLDFSKPSVNRLRTISRLFNN